MKCPKCGFETNEAKCPNCGNDIASVNPIQDEALNIFNDVEVRNATPNDTITAPKVDNYENQSTFFANDATPSQDLNQTETMSDLPKETLEPKVEVPNQDMASVAKPQAINQVNQEVNQVDEINAPKIEQVQENSNFTAPQIEQVSEPTDNAEPAQVVEEKDSNYDPTGFASLINQPNEEIKEVKEAKKSKLPVILIAVIAILLLAAIGVYFFTKGNKASSKTNISKVEVSKAFFIKNGDYSALFNTDGKQLSEFIYKNGENTTFHDGVAYARTDTENMIIDENGKVLRSGKNTDFSLSDVGLFYKVDAGDKVAIINYDQKTIVEFLKNSKYKYEYEDDYFLAEYENSYALYNKDGKELLKGERTTTFDDRSRIQFGLYNKFGYLIVFAEGKNYLYDSNEKLVTTFDSEYRYCIDELVNGDLYFTHCLRDTNERNERKVYSLKNKKVYDIPNEWYKLEANGKQVLANVNPGTYFLKDNYELGREYKGKNYEEFMNEDTYILSASGKVEFYKNGKLVNTVENLNINLGYGAVSYVTDFYILYNRNDKLYYAYDKDGKQLFGKGFTSIDDSKKDGYYRIKDGSKYYIMDSKGKKLTGEYESIYRYETDNGVYYEIKESDKVALLDKSEKKLYECSKCKGIYVDTFLGKDYAEVSEGINKTTVIVDLKTKKEIVKTTGDLWAREQYIEETDGNTKRYYTYTGKKFFEK